MSILSDLGKYIGNKFKEVQLEIQKDKDKIEKLEEDIAQLKSQISYIQHENSKYIHTKDIKFISPDNGIILRDENFKQYRIRINSENKLIVDKIDTNEKYYAEIQLSLSGSELNE